MSWMADDPDDLLASQKSPVVDGGMARGLITDAVERVPTEDGRRRAR